MGSVEELLELLPLLRRELECDGLELELSPEWGSRSSDCRPNIRKALSMRLNEDLTDLARAPEPRSFSVSISHCQAIGGYALLPRPRAIGPDLEITSRIQPRVVARISSKEETSAAPSAAHLWCAKESAYKSLLGDAKQPQVIGDLRIDRWQKIRHLSELEGKALDAWKFHLFLSQNAEAVSGRGVALVKDDVTLSLFCVDAST